MWTEPILHVDMDAFFVEVERLRDRSLIGRPVAVGGSGRRGVVASASYEARARGVRSAQPTATALRVCPDLIVISPSHGRYGEVSARVFEVFREFTPLVEGLSLDEAFLDIGGLQRHHDSPVEVGLAVKGEIRSRLGLPASVGIASSKFMAKLASESAKPDGLRHVPKEAELGFLHPLPMTALSGVGPATMAGLTRLGVVTVGDLAELPEPSVVKALGPAHGAHLLELARGIDPRRVNPDAETKSISVEETYETDLEGTEVIEAALLAQSQRLSDRLRRAGFLARTVTLKVRFADFTTVTRGVTERVAIDSPRDLYGRAIGLARQLQPDRPVRLLGLGASGLDPAEGPRQLALETEEQWARITEAVTEVRGRFGGDAVAPARLVDRTPPDDGSDR